MKDLTREDQKYINRILIARPKLTKLKIYSVSWEEHDGKRLSVAIAKKQFLGPKSSSLAKKTKSVKSTGSIRSCEKYQNSVFKKNTDNKKVSNSIQGMEGYLLLLLSKTNLRNWTILFYAYLFIKLGFVRNRRWNPPKKSFDTFPLEKENSPYLLTYLKSINWGKNWKSINLV